MLQSTFFLPTNCLASFRKHQFPKYSKTLNLFSFWATLIVMSASERNRCFLQLYFVLVTDKNITFTRHKIFVTHFSASQLFASTQLVWLASQHISTCSISFELCSEYQIDIPNHLQPVVAKALWKALFIYISDDAYFS